MSSDLRFYGSMLLVAVVTVALIWGGAYWAEKTACDRIGSQVDRSTEFFMFGGCFVELNDGRSVNGT